MQLKDLWMRKVISGSNNVLNETRRIFRDAIYILKKKKIQTKTVFFVRIQKNIKNNRLNRCSFRRRESAQRREFDSDRANERNFVAAAPLAATNAYHSRAFILFSSRARNNGYESSGIEREFRKNAPGFLREE